MSHVYVEIYKIVQSIPKGRVLTYGIISHMIGGRMSAQGVGWALMALSKEKREPGYDMNSVPWQRVVNAEGGTSTHKIATIPPGLQQVLLEAEGVAFDEQGKIKLKQYIWLDAAANGTASKSSKRKP
ncbi:MAG: MGMT family protein [Cyanobacteria bacterium REEB67]|nr:MGMT family protein [Cyanobacteria bacterium REEB67]